MSGHRKELFLVSTQWQQEIYSVGLLRIGVKNALSEKKGVCRMMLSVLNDGNQESVCIGYKLVHSPEATL